MLSQLRRYLLGSRAGTDSLDTVSLFIHQKLGEVPLNVLSAIFVRLLFSKGLVEIASSVAVHLDLGENGKVDVIIGLGEFRYLGICARFLFTELIAGKTQNCEVRSAVSFL